MRDVAEGQVRDIITDEVSLARTYRHEFAKIAKAEGIDGDNARGRFVRDVYGWFTGPVDLTIDRDALNGALDSLVARGDTALYDGTYQVVAQAFNDRNIPGEAKVAVITINRYRPFAPAALVGILLLAGGVALRRAT